MELLVVIGIIAVLISILIPTLRRTRLASQAVKCQSNLRQIANGFALYANANRGQLPPLADKQPPPSGNPIPFVNSGYHWYQYLGELGRHVPTGTDDIAAAGTRGYVEGIWRCPTVTDDEVRENGSFGWGGGYGVHSLRTFRYLEYQNPYAAPRRKGGPKMTRVKPASQVWLVGDTGRPAGTSGVWMTWVGTFSPPFNRSGSGANTNQPACRHGQDSANVAFFDGHVEAVPFRELNNTSRLTFPTNELADRF